MASVIIITFWIITSLAILLSALVTHFASQLPQTFVDLFLYGKIRGKRTKWSVVQLTEVPKRWFTYFYQLGFCVNACATYYVITCYNEGTSLPDTMKYSLDLLSNGKKRISIDAVSAVLLIAMMTFQNFRRLCECVFVSVYSKSTMNIFHFALGVILYTTFSLTIMIEAPDPESKKVELLKQLKWHHFVGLLLFIWASWHHHIAHVTLANLRRNKEGEVVSANHFIPRGGFFEYISCPHFFMEMVIYISFAIVGGASHLALLSVVFFVISNQSVTSFFTHDWYIKQYADYPKNRKAIIPYLF